MKHVSRFLTALVAACAPALSGAQSYDFNITKARLEQMRKIIKNAGIIIQ